MPGDPSLAATQDEERVRLEESHPSRMLRLLSAVCVHPQANVARRVQAVSTATVSRAVSRRVSRSLKSQTPWGMRPETSGRGRLGSAPTSAQSS
jgi:hypothetical protein